MNSPGQQTSDSDRAIPHDSAGPSVALVGAGPGDPGLLTIRGAELLRRAEVVLFDGLSNASLLDHAADAKHISVGKHGQSRIWKQDEINAELLRHARSGKRVVRLKGGDPAIFARTSDEVRVLREANIDFEIVPGITAALAAGSYAGVPVTHRGIASAVALVTGREESGKAESDLDWDALAGFPGTLVIYMGVTTAQAWTGSLIAAGKSADTPAAIIRRCSLPDQQVIHCTLGEVAGILTPASKMRPPVITIVGPVTELAPAMSWIDRLPLFGRTVMVTRPNQTGETDTLSQTLKDLGADVIRLPAIQLADVDDTSGLEEAIDAMDQFDTLVFCSANGVQYFMKQFFARHDVRALSGLKLASVGAKTAQALSNFHLRSDVTPDRFSGDSLADELIRRGDLRRHLIVRASRGSDDWIDRLNAAGHQTRSVVAYMNKDSPDFARQFAELSLSRSIDWVAVTSGAAAAVVCRSLDQLGADGSAKGIRIATLSSKTSDVIHEFGCEVDVEANNATMESLAYAIADRAMNMDAAREGLHGEPSDDNQPH